MLHQGDLNLVERAEPAGSDAAESAPLGPGRVLDNSTSSNQVLWGDTITNPQGQQVLWGDSDTTDDYQVLWGDSVLTSADPQ